MWVTKIQENTLDRIGTQLLGHEYCTIALRVYLADQRTGKVDYLLLLLLLLLFIAVVLGHGKFDLLSYQLCQLFY